MSTWNGKEGEGDEKERKAVTDLDFDELLDAVDDEDMLVARDRVRADDGLVARAHPAVLEGLAVGGVVAQVAEHDGRRAHEQLARLVVARDVVAFDRDEARGHGREQRAGRPEPDVRHGCRAYDRAGFRQAVALADLPRWVLGLEGFGRLGAEGRGTREDHADGREVVRFEGLGVLGHRYDDRGDLEERYC